jgi:hypothetical protein
LSRLLIVVGRTWTEWRDLPSTGFRFEKPQAAMLTFGCMLAIAVMTSLVRRRRARRHRADSVMLPALLPVMRPSHLSATRHGAFVLGLAGLLFFAAALADPYIPLTTRESPRSGRRVAIVIDALTKHTVDDQLSPDEATIRRVASQIDRLTAGLDAGADPRIDGGIDEENIDGADNDRENSVRQRPARRPAFSGYALVAVVLWLTAATMKLTSGRFQTFP